MFQVPFWDPGVFFGRVSFPSDQEGMGRQRSTVANDLFDFVFFFSIDRSGGGAGKFLLWTSFSQ